MVSCEKFMVNQSKIHDLISWKLWKSSGAVGDRLESKRRAFRREYKKDLVSSGNLSTEEIKWLSEFEFDEDAVTLDEQARKCYLKVKAERPERAAQMMEDLNGMLGKDRYSISDVGRLTGVIRNYISGFVLTHEERTFSESSLR